MEYFDGATIVESGRIVTLADFAVHVHHKDKAEMSVYKVWCQYGLPPKEIPGLLGFIDDYLTRTNPLFEENE